MVCWKRQIDGNHVKNLEIYCRKLPFNNSAIQFSTTANVASHNSAQCTAYSAVVMLPAIHAEHPSSSLGGDSSLYCK